LNYIRVAGDDVIKGQRVNSGEQTRAPSRQLSGAKDWIIDFLFQKYSFLTV